MCNIVIMQNEEKAINKVNKIQDADHPEVKLIYLMDHGRTINMFY